MKEKKYSYWLTSGKFAMLQRVTTISLGVIAFMMIARFFDKTSFGVWGLFIIIASMVETTRSSLIRNGYIVFKSTKGKENTDAIETSSLIINIVFTLLLICVFLIFGKSIERVFKAPELSSVLLYYSIAMIFLVPYSQKEIFLYSNMNFKAIFWMYVSRNALFTTTIFIIFISGINISLSGLAIIYALCIIPGWAVGVFFSRSYSKFKLIWDKNIFKELLHYGKYVFGNNVFSLIFVNTDTFLTARFISTSVSSFYNIGSRVLNFADIPSQVLGDIMFPRATQMVKSGTDSDIKRIYEKTVAATLCFILPFVLIALIFSKYIIIILAGSKYLDGLNVVRVMLFYSLFLPFIKQFGNIMDAKGKPFVNFWIMMVFAAINILINIFAISNYGILGPAIGSLTSYFLLFVTTQFILNRLLNISLINIVKNIVGLYPDYLNVVKNIFIKKSRS